MKAIQLHHLLCWPVRSQELDRKGIKATAQQINKFTVRSVTLRCRITTKLLKRQQQDEKVDVVASRQ